MIQDADQSAISLTAPQAGEMRFIARQPILDCKQQLYGYELLFRAGAKDTFCSADTDTMTRSTLDLSLLLGAESFTEGHRAFVNCTREVLCSGVVESLPKNLVVLEILEDIAADEETVRACHRLKSAGYQIALDDVVSVDDRPAFVEIADIIKVDFLLTDAAQQEALAKRFGKHGVQLLAEKVETHEQFQSALKMGYTLFQGYFFCRPVTMEAKDLPSMHTGYLNVLRKVYEPELDFHALERAIREEPSLCYRLLRYLNSAAFGVSQVNSIVQVLNLLGRDELRKWVSLVTTISLAGPRSTELLRMALSRARFCELFAESQKLVPTDFFLVGLFSLLDAILDRPMVQIVEHVPLSPVCRDALNGVSNRPRQALELAIAGARGEWEILPQLCAHLGCTEEEMWHWHRDAQNWVRSMLDEKVRAG